MVKRRTPVRFLRSEDGVTMVEGVMVLPIVLLVFAAIIEFGFAVYQWNQTVKAMQLGARLAAVSDPLITDAQWTALEDAIKAGAVPGDPVADPDSTPATQSCGAGTSACKADEMDRLIHGSDGICDPNVAGGTPGVCDFNEYINASNLRITYRNSGLGYVGRPNGPVVTVTVESVGLQFRLPLLSALPGVDADSFTIPAHPVTVTSEDLSSCKLPLTSC